MRSKIEVLLDNGKEMIGVVEHTLCCLARRRRSAHEKTKARCERDIKYIHELNLAADSWMKRK